MARGKNAFASLIAPIPSMRLSATRRTGSILRPTAAMTTRHSPHLVRKEIVADGNWQNCRKSEFRSETQDSRSKNDRKRV
jgi:hypothetical protein